MPTTIKLIEGIRSYGPDNVRSDLERVFRAQDVSRVRNYYDEKLEKFRYFGVEGAVTTIQSGIISPTENGQTRHFYISFYVAMLDGHILHHWQFKHPMPMEGKIALEAERLKFDILAPKDDIVDPA